MMKNYFITGLSVSLLFLIPFACKKDPGTGGKSSIRGKIWTKIYDPAFTSLDEQYPGADEDVYIIYGDETSYGDRIRADYEGDFEFKYMRKGKYKIYVYSKDSAAIVGPPANPNAAKKAIVKEVEITDKKQTLDVGTLTIFR